MDENHCNLLGGGYSRPGLESWSAVNLRILEHMLWQRALDAIRARPSFIIPVLTILFSRMGCAETVV
jgi:hypothetical protein